MIRVKRIELVIDAVEKPTVISTLQRLSVNGYTTYEHVGGHGDRGERGDLALGKNSENVTFVIACTENQLFSLIGVLRPLLKEHGGMCLVSDAQWVAH